MNVKNTEQMKLAITQITINNSVGTAMARIASPFPTSAHEKSRALVLHASFRISFEKVLPGFQFWHHIPGGKLSEPRFAHVSITWEGEEGESTQLADVNWPPRDEYEETFAVAIAHMLAHSQQIIQPFYLRKH